MGSEYIIFKYFSLSIALIATSNANTGSCFKEGLQNYSNYLLDMNWSIFQRSNSTFNDYGKNLCSLKDLVEKFDTTENFLKRFLVVPLFGINFAVLYHCSKSENSTKNEELFILSRDENPENFAVQTTELLLRNFGFRSPTEKVDQSECREQRRREEITQRSSIRGEEIMQRSSIRRLLIVPDADYIATILYQRCVASAITAADIANCMERFNDGRFHA